MKEQWKELQGFDPNYTLKVSTEGRISLGIRGTRDSTGRLYVSINGKDFPVDLLVAKAFMANPKGCEYVLHRNKDYSDSCLENLVWVPDEEYRPMGDTPSLSEINMSIGELPVRKPVKKQTYSDVLDMQDRYATTEEYVPVRQDHISMTEEPAYESKPSSMNPATDEQEGHEEPVRSAADIFTGPSRSYMSSTDEYHIGNECVQPKLIMEKESGSEGEKNDFSCREKMNLPVNTERKMQVCEKAVNPEEDEKQEEDVKKDTGSPSMFSMSHFMKSPKQVSCSKPLIKSTADEGKVIDGEVGKKKSLFGVEFVDDGVRAVERPAVDVRKDSEIARLDKVKSCYNEAARSIISEEDKHHLYERFGDEKVQTYDDWEKNMDLTSLEQKARKIITLTNSEYGVSASMGRTKKQICCTMMNGDEKIFESMTAAAKWAGCSVSSISQACNGQCKYIKNMTWRYIAVEDIDNVLNKYLGVIEDKVVQSMGETLGRRERGRQKGETKALMQAKKKEKERRKRSERAAKKRTETRKANAEMRAHDLEKKLKETENEKKELAEKLNREDAIGKVSRIDSKIDMLLDDLE